MNRHDSREIRRARRAKEGDRLSHLTAGRDPDDTSTINWLSEYPAVPAHWDEPMPWQDAAATTSTSA